MKKSILIGLMAMLVLLLTATAASASVAYYHGNFDNNSQGCAKCHVTHAGSWKALLIGGTNQTDFCYMCHNDLTKSPYDVYDGIISTATGEMPSLAGGFTNSFDFDTKNYDATDGDFSNLATNYKTSTSMHGVQTYDGGVWVTNAIIPGSTTTLTGDFRCGSCHNPHGGGDYVNNTALMPRLLREDLPQHQWTDASAFRDWTFTATADAGQGGYQTRVLTGYGNNAGVWCAGCHDLFNQTAHNAGQNAVNDAVYTNGNNKYMHRMNFVLATGSNGQDAIVHKNIQQIALSVGGDLTCLTCHRAHGTASDTSDGVSRISYNRANTNYLGTSGGQNNSTVLLREKNRDVCFHCHGAAQYNKPSQQGI